MKKFGWATFGAVFFGLIGGWIFGEIGFYIGVILGVMTGIGVAKQEEEQEATREATRIQNAQERNRRSKNVKRNKTPSQASNSPSMKVAGSKPTSAKRLSAVHSVDSENSLYVRIVPELIAACIVADGKVPESQIDMATALIENDELIKDTGSALNALDVHMNELLEAYEKSNAIFKLKTTKLLHRLADIKSPLHADRLQVMLDGMGDAINAPDGSETYAFIDKVREKLLPRQRHLLSFRKNKVERALARIESEDDYDKWLSASRRYLAEQLIEEHGDPVAKQSLVQMRNNPSQYATKLKQGARSNDILRLALGVGAGLVAGSALASALQQTGGEPEIALGALLDQVDEKLGEIGGVDNLPIEYLDDQPGISDVGGEDASVEGEGDPAWEYESEGGDGQEYGVAEDESIGEVGFAGTGSESVDEGFAVQRTSDREETDEEVSEGDEGSDDSDWNDDFEF